MKEKETTFFFSFLFLIMKGFNGTREIEGEDLNGISKEWANRF
jgi:hypothetical protein